MIHHIFKCTAHFQAIARTVKNYKTALFDSFYYRLYFLSVRAVFLAFEKAVVTADTVAGCVCRHKKFVYLVVISQFVKHSLCHSVCNAFVHSSVYYRNYHCFASSLYLSDVMILAISTVAILSVIPPDIT